MTTSITIRENNAGPGSTQFNTVNYLRAYNSEEVDRLCLNALRCPDPLSVKNRLKENKDRLLTECIDWIFEAEQYKTWRYGEKVCLLWIKGGAGKGKTMMCIGLIENLSRPQNKMTALTYFFCQNSDCELNTLHAIIKGLIIRLVKQQTVLKNHLRDRWDSEKNSFTVDITSWRTLWDILLEMLDSSNCTRIYVIVDALDECQDDGMAEFLRLIVLTGLDRPDKIKWMLTSRPLDSAERELLASHEQVQVSLDLSLDYVSKAVQVYIDQKVNKLNYPGSHDTEELKQELKIDLNKKAEGTFLWVGLVCKELERVCRDEALLTVRILSPGLSLFYERMLIRLSQDKQTDAQECMRLLKTMTLAYQPLKMEEVGSVTGLTVEEGEIKALVNRCASFIEMQGNRVAFVHKSARDYLAGENTRGSILDQFEEFGHGDIAHNCVSHLTKMLKVNLVDLPRPNSTREFLENLKDEKRNSLLANVDYAATFWVQHLTDTKQITIVRSRLTEFGEVYTFLRERFLEWLECLSLLDKLPQAFKAINTLVNIAKDLSPSTLALVQDAKRFTSRHCQTLANWPLQIYSSAVIFSPEMSVIRKENMGKIPPYLIKIPRMEEDWASQIQTLAGHSRNVNAVVFSLNGKEIASGSSDGTVKLWDITTGIIQKTLVGHSSGVSDVVFSPDGQKIASSSWDGTVKIWDITTGTIQRTLLVNYHFAGVFKVAFSPDGQKIAAGCNNASIKLWDTATGDLLKTLEDAFESDTNIAFSPDGQKIASGCAKRAVKLWDTTTGDLQKFLGPHIFNVCGVAFSPDGKQVVSGSTDNLIALWDVTTGDLLKTLAGHYHRVTTIAFSPDGKLIASGSRDCSIMLRDITKAGSVQKTLVGHFSKVNAVAFSPDGKQVASGSDDRTIKLWDTNHVIDNPTSGLQTTPARNWAIDGVIFSPNGEQIATRCLIDKTIKLWDTATGDIQKTLSYDDDYTIIDSHGMNFDGQSMPRYLWSSYALVFSPNGKQVASGFMADRTIKILDTTTGGLLNILKGHFRKVCAVTFSPDGKQIASGSYDCTIRLWDSTTGGLLKTLMAQSSTVRVVAFSPDGKQLASGSEDCTIKLWDITTGDLLKTLVGNSRYVNAVAFSSDGKQIASGSDDCTIKLWDVTGTQEAAKHRGNAFAKLFSRGQKIKAWQEIKTSMPIYKLRFTACSRHLATNIGLITIEKEFECGQSTSLEPLQEVLVRNQWICYGSIPILWVPPDFPVVHHDSQDNQVVIVSSNNRVLIFRIDLDSLRSILHE